MASSWSKSWGLAWGNSWGIIAPPENLIFGGHGKRKRDEEWNKAVLEARQQEADRLLKSKHSNKDNIFNYVKNYSAITSETAEISRQTALVNYRAETNLIYNRKIAQLSAIENENAIIAFMMCL